jgi:HEAT repeat protein
VLLTGFSKYIATREPTHRGKTLAYWTTQLAYNESVEDRVAIQAIGVRAVPFLLRGLRDGTRVRAGHLRALDLLGDRALPELVKALDDPSETVRMDAVWAMARLPLLERPVASTLSALGKRLQDPNSEIRLATILLLDRMGPSASETVPHLISVLQCREVDPPGNGDAIRQMAAHVLGGFGPAASACIPQLKELLNDPVPCTRQRASLALWRISRDKTLVLPELTRMLNETDLSAGRLAALALCQINRETALEPELIARVEAVKAAWSSSREVREVEPGALPIPPTERQDSASD